MSPIEVVLLTRVEVTVRWRGELRGLPIPVWNILVTDHDRSVIMSGHAWTKRRAEKVAQFMVEMFAAEVAEEVSEELVGALEEYLEEHDG